MTHLQQTERERQNIPGNLFSGQCTSLKNDSDFPKSQRFLSLSRLHPLSFSLDEILKTIRSFDVNKPHGKITNIPDINHIYP